MPQLAGAIAAGCETGELDLRTQNICLYSITVNFKKRPIVSQPAVIPSKGRRFYSSRLRIPGISLETGRTDSPRGDAAGL